MFRKILFWAHLVTGCTVGAIVLVMSVTGVLLAYQRQIITWLDPDFHSTADSARLPIEEMIASVVAQNNATPSAITVRRDPDAAAEVSFGREHVFLVDPHSGAILGESSPGARSFFQNIENWHRWLAVSMEHRAAGRALTGVSNFGFLLLTLSGPFLWMPRKWSAQNLKAIMLFRGGLSGRARDFNWHNVIGIWCAIPLCLITLSGVIMSYPWATNLLYRLTGNEPPPAQQGGQREGKAAESSVAGLNPVWARAEQQVAGWQSLTVRMPPSGRGPATFTIDTGRGGRPDQRSQLTLNRRTGEVIRWEPFSSYNTGRRLRSWFRFLHTGEAGGIAGQTIAAIASAGAAVLVWTGIWLACRRFLRSRRIA